MMIIIDKKWVNIPELLFFQEGPGVRNHQYTTSGIKLLNVANLVNGKVDLTTSNRYISEEEAYGKYNHFLVEEGDFIIASSGIKVDYFEKKMGFVDKTQLPLCMNTSTIRFKTLDEEKLNIKYFMYYLKSISFKQQLSRQITGSAQLNFGPSHLKLMKIPLVSIDVQRNIIDKLEKLEEIIKRKQQQLDEYDTLIKSQFVEMFDDPQSNDKKFVKAPMGNYLTVLTDFSSNGNYKTLDSGVKMYDDPNFAWMVRTTDLESNELSSIKYIDENAYELLSKSKIFGGEIIMNKIGSAGKVYLMPKITLPASLGRNAFLFRYDDRINPIFIYHLLMTDYGRKEIQKYIRGAVTKTITKDDAKSIQIIEPPTELQDDFAQFVQQVNKLKFSVQKSLNETQVLFDALMQEYYG